MSVKSKVTASTLAAGVTGYVVHLLSTKVGVTVDPDIGALVVGALTAGLTFAGGWLKKERVVEEGESFVKKVAADVDKVVPGLAEDVKSFVDHRFVEPIVESKVEVPVVEVPAVEVPAPVVLAPPPGLEAIVSEDAAGPVVAPAE